MRYNMLPKYGVLVWTLLTVLPVTTASPSQVCNTSLSLNSLGMAPQHPLVDKPALSFTIPDSNGNAFKFPPEHEGERVGKPIALFFYPESGKLCFMALSVPR